MLSSPFVKRGQEPVRKPASPPLAVGDKGEGERTVGEKSQSLFAPAWKPPGWKRARWEKSGMVESHRPSREKSHDSGPDRSTALFIAPQRAIGEDHVLFEGPYLKKNPTGHSRDPIFGVYSSNHLGISCQLIKPQILGSLILTQ
jgi:hypothetical protein